MATVPDACLPEIELSASANVKANFLFKRLLQLAIPALTEACEAAQISAPLPVFLAVPEQRCGRPYPALEPFLKVLASQIDYPLDLITSRVFPMGRSAGMNALNEAIKLLLNSPLERIIVGGVDSFFDTMLLGALDEEDRLSSSTTMRGFVPGEGAAFVVLEKSADAGLKLSSPGVAEEPGHMYSEATCLGDGLSTAVAEAVANLDQPVQTVLCSMNGEPGHVKEWGIAQLRNSQAFHERLQLHHPAECYGDLGAATAPTLLALSVLGLEKGYYQGPALVWCASDYEQRGAVVISHG
jgi:3-oxoacyl-[acyl-carrier-protein] synthase-1